MIDPVQALPAKVQAIEHKLDALSALIEARFNDVSLALVEHRQYTEFTFDRLRNEMTAGFSGVGDQISRLERKLDRFWTD
jgi:hypothetical protein